MCPLLAVQRPVLDGTPRTLSCTLLGGARPVPPQGAPARQTGLHAEGGVCVAKWAMVCLQDNDEQLHAGRVWLCPPAPAHCPPPAAVITLRKSRSTNNGSRKTHACEASL